MNDCNDCIINVAGLVKEFRIHERKRGFLSVLRNMLDFDYKVITAVSGIDFRICRGEMIGFIGPNGAGKSTTIKMLCGIIMPTSGSIDVFGLNPSRHRKRIARRIGVVFGQKTQLLWDLPVIESFLLLKDIYDIPTPGYKKNLTIFQELLGIDKFIKYPVRQLSLGQRMKADICASLLHDPEVIYFDEPTIGLDVVAKENIRQFILKINREKQTTVLFTTHDMDDIDKTCRRIILIDTGKIIYDGSLQEFKSCLMTEKEITVQFGHYIKDIDPAISGREGIRIKEGPENKKIFSVRNDTAMIKDLMNTIMEKYPVNDISISSPEIESIVRGIYSKEIDLSSIRKNSRQP